MKLYLRLFILIFLFSACSIDYEYVKTKMWQWDKGYKIGDGDFFDFKDDCALKGDTIFRDHLPVAILKSLSKTSGELKVSSIDGKQIGFYIDSDEFTK